MPDPVSMRAPMARTEPLKRTWRVGLLAILLLTACEDPTLFYIPDEVADYLELRDTQRDQIMPHLDRLQGTIIQYYQDWGREVREARREGIRIDDRFMEDERQATLDTISTVIDGLAGLLDPDQATRLREAPLPQLHQQERARVAREILRRYRERHSNIVQVRPTLQPTDLPTPLPVLSDLRRLWTVYLGPLVPFVGGRGGGNLFPLSVRATLIDPAIRAAAQSGGADSVTTFFHQDSIEIQLTARTLLHPSYLELSDWIVFLENSIGERVEPLRLEQRDRPWDLPDRITQLLFPMDAMAGPSPGFGAPPPSLGRGLPDEGFAGGIQAAHYAVHFPATYMNRLFIRPGISHVSLIMTHEIGSEERAEGRWEFPFAKPTAR